MTHKNLIRFLIIVLSYKKFRLFNYRIILQNIFIFPHRMVKKFVKFNIQVVHLFEFVHFQHLLRCLLLEAMMKQLFCGILLLNLLSGNSFFRHFFVRGSKKRMKTTYLGWEF